MRTPAQLTKRAYSAETLWGALNGAARRTIRSGNVNQADRGFVLDQSHLQLKSQDHRRKRVTLSRHRVLRCRVDRNRHHARLYLELVRMPAPPLPVIASAASLARRWTSARESILKACPLRCKPLACIFGRGLPTFHQPSEPMADTLSSRMVHGSGMSEPINRVGASEPISPPN